jgi:hypothetical protein
MLGTISLNDAVYASGLDPGAAPDWRSVAPSSARRSFATTQFGCTRNERDWFLYLAYSAGERPGTVLRRLAEASAGGALVPFIPELALKHRLRKLRRDRRRRMRRLAKAHRPTRNDHLHRNARLGSRRSAAMTLGIRDLFDYRAALMKIDPNDVRAIVIKLMLNSIYGKFAQGVGNPGSPPRFASPWMAAAITAGTRRKLMKAALTAPKAIVSFMTDGIVIRKASEYPDLPGGREGAWRIGGDQNPRERRRVRSKRVLSPY